MTHSRLTSSRSLLHCASWAMLAVTGCSQLQSDSTFTAIYKNTIEGSAECISCHSPTGSATALDGVQLDFSTQSQAYLTLTSKKVNGATARGTCGSVSIVSSGSPESSYLMGILFSDYGTNDFAGVSGCLPVTTHYSILNLTSSEKTAISQWISEGALNN